MLDLSDVVDISVARIEETPWLGGPNSRWLNILSAEEREQRSRLKFINDRNVFSLAHILLRHELSHHANLRPDEWVFTRGPYGKPMLAPSLMADHALHFSLSHAGSTAVCAITRVGAVGVDTESLARDIDVDAIASIALTADEQVAIAPLEAGAKMRQVLTLWTLKEAYAKAIGVGLLLPMQQYGFRLNPPPLEQPYLISQAPGERKWLFDTRMFGTDRISVAVSRSKTVPVSFRYRYSRVSSVSQLSCSGLTHGSL